jgi:uncharacterized protein
MIDHLPDRLDLLATAEAGRVLQGRILLSSLERALPALMSNEGELQVVLELNKDADGTHYMAGSLQGGVALKCQRCLGQMVLSLDVKFRLGLIRDKDAVHDLSDWYEPFVVSAEPAIIADILSDEVLLALPIVPLHGVQDECQTLVKDYQPPAEDQRENPFAALAELKQKRQ